MLYWKHQDVNKIAQKAPEVTDRNHVKQESGSYSKACYDEEVFDSDDDDDDGGDDDDCFFDCLSMVVLVAVVPSLSVSLLSLS